MRFHETISDAQVLGLVGERLAGLRLARNLTQEQLAEQAGLGVRSLQRLETGVGSMRLEGLIRVCRALGILERLELLLPPPEPGPIEELKRQGQVRQRASGVKAVDRRKSNWKWGEES